MKQLRCVNIMMHISIVLILFFYSEAAEVTGQGVITQMIPSSDNEISNESQPPPPLFRDLYTRPWSKVKINESGCECIRYNCGCCQLIEVDAISLSGKLCANASYLDHQYGVSITVTYNNFAIINETISARNPPPICVGEDIVDAIEVEVCLHIYDIAVDSDKFHACFEILGKIMKLKIPLKLNLGCIDNKFAEKFKYIENNIASNFSSLFFKTKNSTLPPSVIMV